VGIAAGVALAAALPELPYACGLATVHLFRRDTVPDPLLPEDGVIPVRRPEPTAESLAATRADDDVAARWSDRLTAMAAHLEVAR
jgi:O-succinylbenzoate synthase